MINIVMVQFNYKYQPFISLKKNVSENYNLPKGLGLSKFQIFASPLTTPFSYLTFQVN